MRMRRKKNLEAKLEDCTNLYTLFTDDRNFKTSATEKEYLDLKTIFGNDNEVHLEIGCGKGKFVYEAALRNPNINYLAVEKVGNVIVSACNLSKELKNVRFIRCSAEYLEKYIKPNSISRIYLNFSCPFPKARHESHRLTAVHFLEIYKNILKENAEIHQKTDNMKFFEYSLENFTTAGYKLKNISLDLHNSGFEGNIETEYEHRFASQGMPIYRLEAYIK